MWHMTVSEKVVSVKDIEDMPSVTPTETQMIDKSNFSQEQYKMDLQSAYDCGVASTERTGHWIRKDDGNTHCSECDGISYKFEFCPCCGAKMVEPQKSEEISYTNLKMWEELFKAESEE